MTNLILFIEEVTSYVAKGFPVGIPYLDFAKAFDSVPHQRLMKKISAHGIEGNILNPKIIGTAAKIHPALVVFALVAGEHVENRGCHKWIKISVEISK